MAEAKLLALGFDEFSLSGRFNFSQEPNYEKLDLCCFQRNQVLNVLNDCFQNISTSTTSFSKVNMTSLDWGYQYNCSIRTSGNKQAVVFSNFLERMTALDRVKVNENHQVTSTASDLTLIIEDSLRPAGDWHFIQIHCTDNELTTLPTIKNNCTRDESVGRYVCQCRNAVMPATPYFVKVVTTKRGFQDRDADIGLRFTSS